MLCSTNTGVKSVLKVSQYTLLSGGKYKDEACNPTEYIHEASLHSGFLAYKRGCMQSQSLDSLVRVYRLNMTRNKAT